jgi:predicted aldo/keto reductase-like oxidoreductase
MRQKRGNMKNCQYYNKISANILFCGAEQQNVLDCLECSDCEVKTFDSGDAIDIRGKLAFVLKGAVRIYSRDKQRNLLLRRVEKNE